MSVLIKGMEMPKEGTVIIIYKLNGQFYASMHGTELCPLVPVPPHGRLIDADAFLARNAYFADCEFVNPKYDDTLKDLIDRADTIIPAEEGE